LLDLATVAPRRDLQVVVVNSSLGEKHLQLPKVEIFRLARGFFQTRGKPNVLTSSATWNIKQPYGNSIIQTIVSYLLDERCGGDRTAAVSILLSCTNWFLSYIIVLP
jgi:hypothetical protein